MKVGYARVSSSDQNLDRQLESLKGLGVEKIFSEKGSGVTASHDRPELQKMLEFIREHDEVFISSFDRLGRSSDDLFRLINLIKEKGAGIHFIEEKLSLSNGAENIYEELNIRILAALAEFARKQIKNRQKEGVELAKARGVYKGRAPKLKEEEKLEVLKKIVLENYRVKVVQEEYKISRATVWRIVNDPAFGKKKKEYQRINYRRLLRKIL
jgi:DNA invertase Pin-like site-specific DNA recombinase